MEIKRYRAAGGIVLQRGIVSGLDPQQTYVLLLDRPGRGEVRLPKGHIDGGESAEEAALRETVEEAGYRDLTIVADLGHQQVEYEYKGTHYLREERYFLMRLASNVQIQRNQVDTAQFQVRWVPLAEAGNQLTYEAEQQWVERALQCNG